MEMVPLGLGPGKDWMVLYNGSKLDQGEDRMRAGRILGAKVQGVALPLESLKAPRRRGWTA